MGRSKLPIKKIENTTNRQVTFSKRRYGLIKKAYEIAVLCDIDLTLIMLSPSQRLSHFSGRTRVEDVIYRYINLPDRDRGGIVPNREQIIGTLMKIKNEKDLAMQSPPTPGSGTEEIQKEIHDLQQQLENAEEQLRVFEPDSEKFTSLEEFQSCEVRLVEALRRVTQRKISTQQSGATIKLPGYNTVVQYITEAQTQGDNNPLLENDDDHGIDISNVDHMNFGSSDACSGTLRKRPSPTMYESVSQTSGNENAQSADQGCQNDDGFQHFHSSKDLFTSMPPPESSSSFSKHWQGIMEGSTGVLSALDQQAMFLASQSHQLPSSELHL
ncbi:hypothetical protein CASFOL_041865 [Castilleja foliolosa]|uniref:MADS-box domain-containing protein n=1 Tax=Castilleja foliolosa TaxID=1961234 RepID=A0ABD3B8V7_9LAMI